MQADSIILEGDVSQLHNHDQFFLGKAIMLEALRMLVVKMAQFPRGLWESVLNQLGNAITSCLAPRFQCPRFRIVDWCSFFTDE
jgi:hypothetical protein